MDLLLVWQLELLHLKLLFADISNARCCTGIGCSLGSSTFAPSAHLHLPREMHCLLFPQHYSGRCVALNLPSHPGPLSVYSTGPDIMFERLGHLSVYSTVPDIVFEHHLGLSIADIRISSSTVESTSLLS